MTTRAKFKCVSMTKRKRYDNTGIEYDYEFQTVSGNSEEDKRFFASTPSGTIRLSVVDFTRFEKVQA